ncbi:MAG: right-handed parallel beta-helix repeat-containing protein [Fibrobacterota bacterium]
MITKKTATRTKSRRLLTTLALAMVMSPLMLFADVINVPSPGNETISMAMIKAKAGDTVLVARGVYNEKVFIKAGVALVSRTPFGAEISGGGRGTVVTMGKTCTISGFVVKNGTIGIFSNGGGNIIEKCRIINNWQTGIICVRHLPVIEDNVIVFNRSSGIQGWDVRSTVAAINHNTISYNGNHGVAMGGKSNIIIENNVIAFNERFGLKLSDDSKQSEISKNNFYKNLVNWDRIPDGNYSFDPAFLAPRSGLNFRPDPKLCCKAKGSDNENLGTRVH